MDDKKIRVRIAPSPTGYLHLGTVRAALFNYLFAKKEKGVFIVRIEDTDKDRSLPIYEGDILNGLRALGLLWDEGPDIGGPFGPYRQSERGDIYEKYLKQLLEEKKAYWCFCKKEDLEAERQAMLSQGMAPKYSGKCRHLSEEEIKNKIDSGEEKVLRVVVQTDMQIEFTDLIRGKISVNSNTLGGDVVIAKDLKSPLYNFAVVVDDYLMKISHVIRGEDHISNTPKQIVISRALGIDEPKFAHLPLVLSPDRSKMSKRKMATSFVEYMNEGYLPEAILNFLVLLGWHPEGDKEILNLEEMADEFTLKKVQKSSGVFNVERLDWFNSQYIKNLSLDDLLLRLEKYTPENWKKDKNIFSKAVLISKDRLSKLSEFKEMADLFFEIGDYDGDFLVWQNGSLEKSLSNLKEVKKLIADLSEKDFEKDILEKKIMPLAEKLGRGDLLWPLRVALSGKKNSPGPFEIMYVLGKDESLRRIDLAVGKIS